MAPSRMMKAIGFFLALAVCAACSKQEFGLPDQSQNFSAGVTYNNKVDVILMVDNSSSMLQYQNKFATEVPAMVNSLNSLGLDYHIAVVTSDMRTGGNGGRFVGTPRYLTKSTPNLVGILQSRVTIGQNGSDLERGLESIKTVLQPSYLGGEGAGFFRDDALLAMIVLTNEDDYSTDSVSSLEAFFDALKPPFKGTTKSWVMNFIGVVTIDGQCRTTADFKEAGLRYMALADYTGGIKNSVCDTSLSTAVSNVRKRIVEIMSEYKLDRPPVLSSIHVTINGVTVPQDATNGWTYHSDTNSIRFHGSAQPGAFDSVKVDYTPASGT
jgi:hypothetical protein